MSVRPESFVRFVYPFLFSGEEFAAIAERIDSATYDANPSKTLWERGKFPVAEMLPHVAKYLNPESDKSESKSPKQVTAKLWKINKDALQAPAGLGSRSGIEWTLKVKNKAIEFKVADYQLALFRVGVGFLSVRVELPSKDLADWQDLLHYFRFLKRSNVTISAQRRVAEGEYKEYFPSLAVIEGQRGGAHTFSEIVNGLLSTGQDLTTSDPWWKEVFIHNQALPYAGIFLDNLPKSEEGIALYRLHNFFHSTQEIYPAPGELTTEQDHLLCYAERMWWIFSLDGGAFLSCDTPDTPFFRQTLLDHIDKQYFVLYLLALHQRFALMGLSKDVSDNWVLPDGTQPTLDDDEREKVFSRIRNALLAFTARGKFAQVMQRRHHHRCYHRWLETFQVEVLFNEVSHEVRDMHEYLLMRKTERLEKIGLHLNVLATVFAPPVLILALFDAWRGDDLWNGTIVIGTLFGFAVGVMLAGWFFPKVRSKYINRIKDFWKSLTGPPLPQ